MYIMIQQHKVNLHNQPDGKLLQVFDCRGFPRQCGEQSAFVKDLEKTIMGCIKDNYEVWIVFKFTGSKMLYSSEYKALFNTGKRKKYMIFVYYIIKQNEGTYQDVYHNNLSIPTCLNFRGGGVITICFVCSRQLLMGK